MHDGWSESQFRIAPLSPHHDLTSLWAWLADPRIARGLNLPARDHGAEAIRRYVASFDGDSGVLLGIRHPDDDLAGVAAFNINPRHRTASWTLTLGDRSARSEAALLAITNALFDWAFGPGRLDEVSSRIAAHKLVLIHFLDRVGVRREGYLRGELMSPEGSRRMDEVMHGLLATEWPVVRDNASKRLEDVLRRRAASS